MISTIIVWCEQRIVTLDREIALRRDDGPLDEYVTRALFRARREEIDAVLQVARGMQKNDEMLDRLLAGTLHGGTAK